MKTVKVFLAAVLMMATTATFAQKNQGGLWFEGNLGFTTYGGTHNTGVDKLDSSTFNIGIGGNYMVSKDWSIGLNLGYKYTSDQTNNIGKDLYNKTNLFTVTPQANYFMRLTPKLTWTPRVYASFEFGKEKDDLATGGTYDKDISNMEFGVNPISLDYAITKNISFNFSMDIANLYYRSEKMSNDNWKDDEKTNTSYFQFGKFSSNLGDLGFHFGFRYFL
jgi:hypothetical protein